MINKDKLSEYIAAFRRQPVLKQEDIQRMNQYFEDFQDVKERLKRIEDKLSALQTSVNKLM
jgi:tetrahydromethanopterin S-methyltransferase subunit G